MYCYLITTISRLNTYLFKYRIILGTLIAIRTFRVLQLFRYCLIMPKVLVDICERIYIYIYIYTILK